MTLLLVVLCLVMKRVGVGATDLFDDPGSLEVAGDSEGTTCALLAVRAVTNAVDLGFARHCD